MVLQVLDRLSLGVQNDLYALDDIFAMRQKQSQQLDVGLKRRTFPSRCAPAMNLHPFEREYNGD